MLFKLSMKLASGKAINHCESIYEIGGVKKAKDDLILLLIF